MGIGIIALGLWLLLGISFSINSIELFPDALSMMVIMVGIVIVFRRVKSRELLISLGLWIVSFVMELFQLYFFNQWIWLLALAFVYIGIDHIAVDYPALKKYRYSYRIYLTVYVITLLLGELILKTNEASFHAHSCLFHGCLRNTFDYGFISYGQNQSFFRRRLYPNPCSIFILFISSKSNHYCSFFSESFRYCLYERWLF